MQEATNAIYTVLYEQISMGQEDLLRETANKLGYTRLGNNVLSALALGIQYAQAKAVSLPVQTAPSFFLIAVLPVRKKLWIVFELPTTDAILL